MARLEVNRSGEMDVFVRVVELGGFSPAARMSRMTPSAVSKLIARLEARLGARLLNRSTRQLQLTPEGCAFYERATRILADLEDAERAAGLGEQPVGRVRINTSASYANHVLAPLLPDFLALHPGVTLDIVQTDAVVDLLAERMDVAIRAGPLKSSSLVARKLGETALTIVAAPSYLERCGEPRTITDLERHNRLGFGYARAVDGWPLRENGETIVVPATGRVQASDGEGLRHLALAGVGLGRLAAFTVRQDIAAGRLIPVLGHLDAGDREAFHAVHVGQGGPLPSRVRALLDFLAEKGRVS
ncbi:LysR family transcriptional regulator [Shinella sumterensis]|uniref:LysR family transcriptional regulator n=1 Tax=Brucella haematophila TaxID=419474 RepID=A0ABX1DN19_9HYPH|nr:LysR family transcriptional regulator [Brucella haematophila]NKC04348.1 LysR family transcriptional regulator [Brucella haematophila]TMV06240.1 LysR family transcriptional regulator [Brucella haematophila]WLS06741.1 LysR family transcriptional regulator [Shinella sumterensis]WLS09129.1 LysR family transcriptional regulator [Shinella sumterensis]